MIQVLSESEVIGVPGFGYKNPNNYKKKAASKI